MDINEIENLRIKARNKVLTGSIISIVLGLTALIFNFTVAMIVTVVGIVITTLVSKKSIDAFNSKFKGSIVLETFKKILTDIVYEPNIGMPEQIISSTRMMNMGDRYSSNDYLQAKYKGIKFLQADVHIEEERETTDSEGHTRRYYVTLFRGRWMVFDFNKRFKANIQVCEKSFTNSTTGSIFSKDRLKKIELEDMEFNKEFKTFAQNDLDAFYVLTPSLMERIKKLNDSINGSLLLCFVDNQLHVGFNNNQDSFEHSIFKKINIEEDESKISSDIKIITQFIDELNLSNDLFRKEVN